MEFSILDNIDVVVLTEEIIEFLENNKINLPASEVFEDKLEEFLKEKLSDMI